MLYYAIEEGRAQNEGGENMEKKWFTIEESSEYLRVSPSTIFRWVKAGRLPVYRVEGITRLKISDLDAFLETGKVVPGGDTEEGS